LHLRATASTLLLRRRRCETVLGCPLKEPEMLKGFV
jgi:hypothetical protein